MNFKNINQQLVKRMIISGPSLISNIDKFIFIHLPRTGGKSIKTAFFSKYSSSLFYNLEHRLIFKILKKNYPSTHSSLEEIKDKININKIKKYDKFSIVRDPFTRLISIYKHLIYYYTSKLNYSQCENIILDLVTPRIFIENIKKKSLTDYLPSSHHKLFASLNKEFYFPDRIFSWKNISACHDYLRDKYNFSYFISTSSNQINEILPAWREPSSTSGIQPLIDDFINNHISSFNEFRSDIVNLWDEEISIIDTSKLNPKGEIIIDKSKFIEFLIKKNKNQLKALSYQNDYKFFDKDIISKSF